MPLCAWGFPWTEDAFLAIVLFTLPTNNELLCCVNMVASLLVKNCAIGKTGRPCPLNPDENWARNSKVGVDNSWGRKLAYIRSVCKEKLPVEGGIGARLEE